MCCLYLVILQTVGYVLSSVHMIFWYCTVCFTCAVLFRFLTYSQNNLSNALLLISLTLLHRSTFRNQFFLMPLNDGSGGKKAQYFLGVQHELDPSETSAATGGTKVIRIRSVFIFIALL